MTISVEFRDSGVTDFSSHPKARRETQVLGIDQGNNQPEIWEVVITDPTNHEFKLVFTDPVKGDRVTMNKAATPFISAEDFKDRIENPFYQQRVKSLTEVIRTSYNANGDVTEDK